MTETATDNADRLIKLITDRKAKIAIAGIGYVGLPLAISFGNVGFEVIGFDVDEEKVNNLNAGNSYIKHIDGKEIAKLTKSKKLTATTNFSQIQQCDCILLCVPTPLTPQLTPNLEYVENTARIISKFIRKGQIVILESTTYPGTTSDVMIPILESNTDLKAGIDFFVAYSPEREDPANMQFGTTTIPKVVGADDEPTLKVTCALYESIINKVVAVSSSSTAEAVKLTENIFRSVNIALVNELKVIFDQMDIDVWEVIDAAASKPFGYMPFYPGPGLGGHCIPIDPFYLSWKAKEYGITARFIELAGEVNRRMPAYVISNLSRHLSDVCGLPLKDAKILVVGIAYKKNVDDMRESPALSLMEMLTERGSHIEYHDNYIPVIHHSREHDHFAGMKSISLTKENLQRFDAVLVCTDHDGVDWNLIAEHSKMVVDTRNVMRGAPESSKDRIFKS